ncbi:hypothetical protein [Haloarcula sp. JP-L23]|uniref:hypothetical protein n=1 Tax=Haloarcula sp. JP-L23 TaxID=2716717 RepID=UPI00140F1EB6|nr:hypothetical protein G9465_04320 [Haloarcula sp. JP-L23]
MSVADRLLAGETVDVSELRDALWRAVLGDRVGATLAMGSLVWVCLTWHLGFFSNDQYTFANALLAVADGHLHVTEAVYGPASGATPGTYLVDGRVYGRNYGVVLVSAVWYVVLRSLSLVADVRVLLVGLWSLAVASVGVGVGRVVGRPDAGRVAGIVAAAGLFVASLALTTPLSTLWLPLLALQLTTALAAVLLTVVCYRLVTRLYDRRLGVAAAVATIAATPVGFWAPIPKRHSVTALLVVCAMYTLYRSREADTRRSATRFRALTYVWVGATAWVHAPEGFVLLVAVGVVDLPTARWNGVRALLSVGAALALSLLPFLLTNAAVSGNPLQPPRLLSEYTGDVLPSEADAPTSAGGSGGGGGGDSGASGGGGTATGGSLFPAPLSRITSQFVDSYGLLFDPEHLFRVFVRTGYVPTLRPTQDAAVNLSVLASMPLLGVLVGYPVLAIRRGIARSDWPLPSPRQWSPARVLDAFTVLYALLLVGLYLETLPSHHMFTVRYLHPLYALGVYWLVRMPTVRRVVATERRTLTFAYAATVILGTPTSLAAIAVGRLVLSEAVQLFSLVALTVAVGLAVWAVAAVLTDAGFRVGACTLGVAAGATTVYLLVAGLSLFPTSGEFLLPLSRAVSETVHYARLLGSSPPP